MKKLIFATILVILGAIGFQCFADEPKLEGAYVVRNGVKQMQEDGFIEEDQNIWIDGVEYVYHDGRVIGAILREGVLEFQEGTKKAYWICGKHLQTLAKKTPPNEP